MQRRVGLVGTAILVAACGGPAPSAGTPTANAPTDAAAQPTDAAPSTTEAAATGGGAPAAGYLICPKLEGDACPVPPGPYRVDIHDAFELTVPDAGWVELPAADEDEPRLTLVRADAPEQRVSIDSGPTGPILDDTGLRHLLDLPVAAGSTDPAPASIGGASGYQVDLAGAGTGSIGLGQAGAVELETGQTYRVAAVQDPMDQEGALKIIIIAAPDAEFEAFAPIAQSLLDTVQFVH